MPHHSLRIGLLAYTSMQQRTLRFLVEECGYDVGSCLLVSDLEKQPDLVASDTALASDAWVVAVDSDSGEGPATAENSANGGEQQLEQWLEQWLGRDHRLDRHSSAVIFCDGAVPGIHDSQYPAWSRRLTQKLNQLTGVINLAQTDSAREVWVLAASTGGPAAVKQFLSELPADLGIGFIYVQHINTGFKDTLAQAISRDSHYPAHVIGHGSVVRANEVAIVSRDNATELLPNGTFLVNNGAWSAPYCPSADYIVANVAHSYRDRSGVIIFTGMGDDGAASSRLMRQKGGQVWVQTPESCTIDSMPLATIGKGCVDFQGNPQELARHLVHQRQSARLPQPSAVSGEASGGGENI